MTLLVPCLGAIELHTLEPGSPQSAGSRHGPRLWLFHPCYQYSWDGLRLRACESPALLVFTSATLYLSVSLVFELLTQSKPIVLKHR